MVLAINIFAIIISPVIAVIVGQKLQDRQKQRADQMDIFKILMINRGLGWSIDKVKALNLIEVVFSDKEDVLKQWRNYYNKLCIANPTGEELIGVKEEEDRLLYVMSKALDYKDKISLEVIKQPYIPQGLVDGILQQKEIQKTQMDAINAVLSGFQRGARNERRKAVILSFYVNTEFYLACSSSFVLGRCCNNNSDRGTKKLEKCHAICEEFDSGWLDRGGTSRRICK